MSIIIMIKDATCEGGISGNSKHNLTLQVATTVYESRQEQNETHIILPHSSGIQY